LSPAHFQRLFHRFAGVSPKRFLQYLTSEQARRLLKQSVSILDTSFAVGLSGSGHPHDLLINVTAVTPGEYKSGGISLQIKYAVHQTPFGRCFIAITERGVCQLEFIDSDNGTEISFERLDETWPNANITEDLVETEKTIQRIFSPREKSLNKPLLLLLQGTNFQLQVWQALLKIPVGCVASYSYLAKAIGKPTASRAIGTAIGNNPISYLIPCHRVLRSDGEIGGYRWGIERKLAILGKEFCEIERSNR
jgi:AraC family transcriptional regulator of adaptative response/methylated-DNA-[protein]-cysteine methyltransferase